MCVCVCDELFMRERKERENGKRREKGREANSYTDQGTKWATGKTTQEGFVVILATEHVL